MQTWDAIRARRNVRSYQTRQVPAVEREQGSVGGLFRASRHHYGRYPWRPAAARCRAGPR